MADEEQPQRRPAPRDRWRFKDVETLWDALERYHHYHEGAIVRNLQSRGSRGTCAQGIQLGDEQIAFMMANQSIDRAMMRLGVVEPKLHLLLHHYYRRGLNEDANGWLEAMQKAGLVLNKKERCSRPSFDWSLERAVWVLFALHRAPRRGW